MVPVVGTPCLRKEFAMTRTRWRTLAGVLALTLGGAALKDAFAESRQRELLRREHAQARLRQAQAAAALRPRYDLD